jgi:hypothetical protein
MAASFGSIVVNQTSAPTTITIANTGEASSGSISAAISGSSGSNFVLGTNNCTTLASAATCTIDVSFRPTSAGVKTAQLVVTASPGTTIFVELDGTGVNPGALSISPSTHNFGTRTIGATGGATQTFTVTNTGGQPTTAMTSVVGGTNPGEFTKTADTCNTMTLVANATCTFTLAFAPATAGSKFGNVTVSATQGGSVTASVNGNAVTQAALVANPTAIDFGSVPTSSPSSTITVTVLNTGGVASGTILESTSGNADFTIVTSSCTGATLAPGGTCNFTARFTPAAAGARAAQLALTATPGGTVTIDATGTGIVPGALSIEPSPFVYASTVTGQTTTAAEFTVRNTGGVGTGAIAVSLGGNDPGQFSITANTCTASSLAPNGTCTISVVFGPTAIGQKSAFLFAAATPGGTAQATISGLALPTAQLAISPSSRDFGSIGNGTMSAQQSFTVQNTGGTSAAVPVIALAGANAGQFSQTNDCNSALDPTETCTVLVRFVPTALGAFSATVTATSGASVVSASVFGEGVAPDALSVNPSVLPFPGTVLIGQSSANDLSFTVTNNGGAATGGLTVATTGPAAADFQIITSTCTNALAPQGTCSVTVRFTPTAGGARNATITVSGSPGGSVGVAVSGDAVATITIVSVDGLPPPAFNPYDYGIRSVGSSTCVAVVVRNNTSQVQTLTRTADYGIPAQFAHTGGCVGASPATIAANGTITQQVRFVPTSSGVKNGTLTFSIGPGLANQAVQTFRGTGADSLTIEAVTSASFGLTATGSTSHPLQFRVTNRSDAPTSGVITTDVLQTARFRITQDLCNGNTLAAGGSCLITVVFEPIVDGLDQAVLGVSATPGGQPNININGTGVPGVLLSGTVTGHTTSGTLVLRNNGYDDVTVASNQGSFTFPRRIGSVYSVTVVSNPPGRTCAVANGSGVATTFDITNVVVTCTPLANTSYLVNAGPFWPTNPPTQTCLEACASLFGGTSTNWACSTVSGSVNNQAYVSQYGGPCSVQSESFKVHATYVGCPGGVCAVSAYVQDHCNGGQRNYCFVLP